jgi:hypothetical protein
MKTAWMLGALCVLGACAARPAQPPPSHPQAASPAAAEPRRSLDECKQLLIAHRALDEQLRCFAHVETATLHERTNVAYLEVTALLYDRKYAEAARVFDELLTRVRENPPSALAEGWVHNGLTWVYWGAGDFTTALAENQRVQVAADALAGDEKRQLLLHYWWDRAALLIEHAAADASSRKPAEEARIAYRKLAHLPDEHDGLAVLDAFFAYSARDGRAARKAAVTVDLDHDGDVQDLYIIALAVEAGGDAKSAHAICERIAQANEYPMKPLVLDKMSHCGAPAGH